MMNWVAAGSSRTHLPVDVAGLTHSGFYRHFDSKEQLVAEANDEALAELIKRIADPKRA
jgi:AcrR family transcriptional regulator